MSLSLPPAKDFTAEGWPAELRKTLEGSLVRSLNEFARPVRALLAGGLTVGNLNGQLLERRVVVPADWDGTSVAACWGGNCEFPATIRGNLLGVMPLGAAELDDASQPRWDRPVSMPAPAARLVPATNTAKARIRIENQTGLVAGRTYLCRWLALGD